MLMNTLQFHFSNWQELGLVWVISVSFAYTGLPVSHHSHSNTSLILLIGWSLPCYFQFAYCLFVWLIKLKCTPHPSHH